MLTKNQIIENLKKLGLKNGSIIELVVSDAVLLSIIGNAQTLLDAIVEVIGYNGTILMFNKSDYNVDPSLYVKDNLENLVDTRNALPAFNKKETDSYLNGPLLVNLKNRDGVIISDHPSFSFVAWGKYAKLLCNHQSLNFALSQESPLARLMELRGTTLVIGEDFEKVHSLNLASYYSGFNPIIINAAMNSYNGDKIYQKYLDIELDNSYFKSVFGILKAKGHYLCEQIHGIEFGVCSTCVAIEETKRYLKEESLANYYKV